MPKLINSELTEKIIGCAITVHKSLGPGLLEKFYEEALCLELESKNLKYERQLSIALYYRGQYIGHHRVDLLVENKILLELKAIKNLEKIHYSTVLSYLNISKAEVALLLNFNSVTLSIKRFAGSVLNLNTETQKIGNTESLVDVIYRNDKDHPKQFHKH